MQVQNPLKVTGFYGSTLVILWHAQTAYIYDPVIDRGTWQVYCTGLFFFLTENSVVFDEIIT